MSVIDYLVSKPDSFYILKDFSIGSFNVYSDHAFLSFTIKGSFVSDVCEGSQTFVYKWDDKFWNIFRSSLMEKLPFFNNLVTNIDVNSRGSVNHIVNQFSSTITELAKDYRKDYTERPCTNDFSEKQLCKDSDWFDNDCPKARQQYKNALNLFNRNRSDFNRQQFCKLKKDYKKLCRQKRKNYENVKIAQICDVKISNPKQFWNFFKKKQYKTPPISIAEFKDYFSSLGSDVFNVTNQEAEDFCPTHDFTIEDSAFDELNSPITHSELLKATKSLKRCKSMGSDEVMTKYLIESIDILSSHICDIFNGILDSGVFPDKWSEGIIIPIHKKGATDDINNY